MSAPSLHSFGVSEYAIEQAVQSRLASPGFFQRVVEQVASGLYPELANRLVPFGRNPDDKSVRGWPDAHLALDDGALIAIEATTARSAVAVHWTEDLRKLRERLDRRLRGGFIWACWSDEPDPRDFLAMRTQVAALGVPADRIHILFRKGLCSQLPKARYARFWREALGLPITVWPFVLIEDVPRLYGREANNIVPTKE